MMPLDKLLIHPQTKAALLALLKNPSHALIFSGKKGMGKSTLAEVWADSLNPRPIVMYITPDEKGTISIAVIRDLYKTTRAKQVTKQIVCINDAEKMSIEAQNAFLKLLEEPRPELSFILTASDTNALLPTINSRAQNIQIKPMETKALNEFARQNYDQYSDNDLNQMLFIADGRPGKLVSLLENADEFEKEVQRMQQIKALLTADKYQKYLAINKLATNREECLETLGIMARISGDQLLKPSHVNQMQRWLKIASAIEIALTNISKNGSLKAQLLLLFNSY